MVVSWGGGAVFAAPVHRVPPDPVLAPSSRDIGMHADVAANCSTNRNARLSHALHRLLS